MKYIISVLFVFSALKSFAANEGRVEIISFVGKNEVIHPDVVQIKLVGGFEKDGCATDLAAIRAEDSHLVSAALAAKMGGKAIRVNLSSTDKYFSDRCVINSVTIFE